MNSFVCHFCRRPFALAAFALGASMLIAQTSAPSNDTPGGSQKPASPASAQKISAKSASTEGKNANESKAAVVQPLPVNSIDNGDSGLLTASPLKITLTPSETPLKLGSTSNIAADIQNVSNVPVEIDTSEVQLMVHAILSHTDSLCVVPLRPVTNTNLLGLLVLQPQDHVSVLFNLSQETFAYNDAEKAEVQKVQAAMSQSGGKPNDPAAQREQALRSNQVTYRQLYQRAYQRSCDPSLFGPLKRAIDFTPGTYNYFVTGKFSVCDPTNAVPCPDPSRSFSESAAFAVGIDQMQIIIFAIIGGLLAYVVVAARGDAGSINQLVTHLKAAPPESDAEAVPSKGSLLMLLIKVLRDLMGVAILSAAFTIVSSRLSDSQFPIKVSVLDAWGAITIGFLSYFVGNKFIDSLRNLVK
ncbi:MAG TPA: hypothetical protein VMU48_01120 [Terracidiphilus sp.]|nr:hypothetical protein [Terracidiphilus sp.]